VAYSFFNVKQQISYGGSLNCADDGLFHGNFTRDHVITFLLPRGHIVPVTEMSEKRGLTVYQKVKTILFLVEVKSLVSTQNFFSSFWHVVATQKAIQGLTLQSQQNCLVFEQKYPYAASVASTCCNWFAGKHPGLLHDTYGKHDLGLPS
jgi:hypothetical protein